MKQSVTVPSVTVPSVTVPYRKAVRPEGGIAYSLINEISTISYQLVS